MSSSALQPDDCQSFGHRHAEIRLDNQLIFSGELLCANGSSEHVEDHATKLIFCSDSQVSARDAKMACFLPPDRMWKSMIYRHL